MADSWQIDPELKAKTTALAREFRKAPTRSEDLLWQALRGRSHRVRFRRQQPIGPFIVDFYCAAARLVIEVDGPVHLKQAKRDRARQALLESLGLTLLRVSSDAVESNLGSVLATIESAVARRVAASPIPHPSPRSGEGDRNGGA